MTIISILIDMSLVSNVCVLAVLFMHICLSIAILDVEMQSQGKGKFVEYFLL